MHRLRPAFVCAVAILLCTAPSEGIGKSYKGAEYRTKDSFLYGRFEVRMKAIGREGTLSSFFTYNDSYPSTPWNEIDIEVMGRYSDDVQLNTITPGNVNHVSHRFVPFDPAADFHVYAIEWTPTYVAWFIDSVEVCRQTGTHITSLNQPQKIMMNVWNPIAPNWAGTWNEVVLPAFARYDWVRYASYTPGAGTSGTGNNFSPQWLDEFSSWDQSRWDKASHTWAENNCDFIPQNIAFQDGNLILCLTKDVSTGYVDVAPPGVLWARVERAQIRLRFSEEVTSASATNISNYVIGSGGPAGATLLPDGRTVLLDVPGADTLTVSGMIVRSISDRWTPANTMSLVPVALIKSTPLSLPLSINVGGAAYQSFRADQEWGPSVEYGRMDGQTAYSSGASIAGTSDPEVYRSELYGFGEYHVRVPNGSYFVSLMMAENYFTVVGKRVMRLVVEGKELEAALDLISRIGYRTAYQRATFVDVTDGTIDIHIQGLVDQPLLNGITIMSVATGVNDPSSGETRPDTYTLVNYPNPFNGGTRLSFLIPVRDQLTLKVYDALGRLVSEQGLGEFPAGEGTVAWQPLGANGTPLASGVYYCYLEGTGRSPMRKLVYLK